MKRIALYPGTFDPITNGHADLIARALSLFDHVVVAVNNTHTRKQPWLSLEQRLHCVRLVCGDNPRLCVVPLHGLLVDLAQQQQAQCIIRGLRTTSDFNNEYQQMCMNLHLRPSLETIFLPTQPALTGLSSTLVRDILMLGGDVAPFVPKSILQYLTAQLAHGA